MQYPRQDAEDQTSSSQGRPGTAPEDIPIQTRKTQKNTRHYPVSGTTDTNKHVCYFKKVCIYIYVCILGKLVVQ